MKLTITIESNNAAFDDGAGGRLEAGSILADIADRLRLMPLDSVFPLRDSNGNKVGEIVLGCEGDEDDA